MSRADSKYAEAWEALFMALFIVIVLAISAGLFGE